MSDSNHSVFEPGDLVKKRRHGENQAGLVLETGIQVTTEINTDIELSGAVTATWEKGIKIMWETGTATIELDDELDLIATRHERGRYLVEGDTTSG